jgi:hypothetical protein
MEISESGWALIKERDLLAIGCSKVSVVNPALNSLETGLLTVDSKLPF